ncbi:MAG: hypothetical protein ACYC0H_05620 [Solirubrobacteraceae bacterium]
MDQALASDGQEPRIGRDPHDRLGHAQRDDLSIGHDPLGVISCFGQEIVSGAEHRYQQQVEVGEHRGSSLESAVTASTADFDPLCYVPFFNPAPRAPSVELLI